MVIWWKRGRIGRRDVLPLIPFFVIAISMGLLTAWLEKHYVGASGRYFAMSSADRILLAGRVPWFYLKKLVVPYPLIFVYPRWVIDSRVAWQYLFLLACLGTLAALWFARGRIGRGPLAAALFFGGTLFPVLGFVNVFPFVYSYVADHFQYLASIGPIAIGAAIIGRGVGSLPANAKRVAAVSVSVALAVAMAVLTWRQSRMYIDLETLWRTTIARNPDAWLAHGNLASVLIGQKKFPEAMTECQRSLELYEPSLEAHDNMVMLLLRERRIPEAIVHMKRTIELQDELMTIEIQGNYAAARYALGSFLLQLRRPAEAAVYFNKALELDPQNAQARKDLRKARRQLGISDTATLH